MRLKFSLACLLGFLLVVSPAMTADQGEAPPDTDRPACLEDQAEESSGCCMNHGRGRAGHGMGPGGRHGNGCGACPDGMGGQGADARFETDRDLFHFLLDHRSEIRRTVEVRDDGVETLTESKDPEVAKKIREHVASMYQRVEEGMPIHRRDPLFAEIFRHTDKIRMSMKSTKKGIRVIETSEDPYVASLIQAHATVLTKFIENGHSEVHRNHPVPGRLATGDEEAVLHGDVHDCLAGSPIEPR